MLADIPTLAWFLAFAGASLIGWGVTRLEHAGAVRRWPRAAGVVTAARRIALPPDSLTFGDREPSSHALLVPEIQIDFTVGDRAFRIRHPREAPVKDSLGLAADHLLAQYPVGRRVAVAYNPEAPGEALVVEAATSGPPGGLLLAAGVVSLAGAFGVAWQALG